MTGRRDLALDELDAARRQLRELIDAVETAGVLPVGEFNDAALAVKDHVVAGWQLVLADHRARRAEAEVAG